MRARGVNVAPALRPWRPPPHGGPAFGVLPLECATTSSMPASTSRQPKPASKNPPPTRALQACPPHPGHIRHHGTPVVSDSQPPVFLQTSTPRTTVKHDTTPRRNDITIRHNPPPGTTHVATKPGRRELPQCRLHQPRIRFQCGPGTVARSRQPR